MSIFRSISKNLRGVIRGAAPAILGAALPGVGGAIAGALLPGATGGTGRGSNLTRLITQALGQAAERRGAVNIVPGAGAIAATPPIRPPKQPRQVVSGRIGPVGTVQVPIKMPTTFGGQAPQTSFETFNVGAGAGQMSIFSALPRIVRSPAVRRGAEIAGGAVLGAALVGPDGQPMRRRRRMNFGNAKAARRAIRRIKGTRKLLQDIEKQLPRRTVTRRAPPAGHRSRLTHE